VITHWLATAQRVTGSWWLMAGRWSMSGPTLHSRAAVGFTPGWQNCNSICQPLQPKIFV
jgi:hypothetical protein